MSKKQFEANATELWLYFQSVIQWVIVNFPVYRKEMLRVNWGALYRDFPIALDKDKTELLISKLMSDDDVTKKSGIYPYIFTQNESYLNIRSFSSNQKREIYEKQNGVCTRCLKTFTLEEMEGDHIIPWSKGGKTNIDNCQMLCKRCNRIKSGV